MRTFPLILTGSQTCLFYPKSLRYFDKRFHTKQLQSQGGLDSRIQCLRFAVFAPVVAKYLRFPVRKIWYENVWSLSLLWERTRGAAESPRPRAPLGFGASQHMLVPDISKMWVLRNE